MGVIFFMCRSRWLLIFPKSHRFTWDGYLGRILLISWTCSISKFCMQVQYFWFQWLDSKQREDRDRKELIQAKLRRKEQEGQIYKIRSVHRLAGSPTVVPNWVFGKMGGLGFDVWREWRQNFFNLWRLKTIIKYEDLVWRLHS